MNGGLPRNESERLAALLACRILDTEEEEDFEALTKLAAQICQTPIAAVSLVDHDRQWFKARVGLEARETPRDVAFCAHTIRQRDEFLVVSDASKDERFADNPLVTGDPRIRFYAGFPLDPGNGLALGALCVIDREPRELSDGQLDALRVLAKHASHLIDARRREAELIESQQRFQALADGSDEGVAIVKGGVVIEVNHALCRLTGRPRAALLGIDPSVLVTPRERARVTERLREVAEDGPLTYESEVVRADGTVVPVRVTAKTVAHGGARARVSVIRDLSKELHAERTQREFISVVSHELRTPLTSIHGSLRLLASGKLTELTGKAQQLVRIASANAERLIQLTNDLLDMDKADSDRLALTLKPHRVRQLIAWAHESVQGVALSREIAIRVLDGPSLDSTVVVDGDRVRQIITNLLGNALKFSSPGGAIEVGAEVDGRTVRIEVLDRGPGVPESERKRIFERFRQARTGTLPREGSGLGLTVSRALARRHGGEVGMRPREGGGSIFWLELLLDDG